VLIYYATHNIFKDVVDGIRFEKPADEVIYRPHFEKTGSDGGYVLLKMRGQVEQGAISQNLDRHLAVRADFAEKLS
jgi:hypothetical protein